MDIYADDPMSPNTMLIMRAFAGIALYGDASNDENNQIIRRLDCLSRNLVPVWCCWDFREGSKELAAKLALLALLQLYQVNMNTGVCTSR